MIIIDIETTGLDPRRHSLLSIGAVNFNDSSQTFYGECRMHEGADVMEEILELNGFTEEQINDKSKQTPSELIEKFVAWLNQFKDQTIGGHNVYNDLGFLRIEAFRADLEYRFSYRIVDLHSVAYVKRMMANTGAEIDTTQKTGLEIDDILAFSGLERDIEKFHALEDAKLEAECFARLAKGKSMFEDYSQYEVPNYLKR